MPTGLINQSAYNTHIWSRWICFIKQIRHVISSFFGSHTNCKSNRNYFIRSHLCRHPFTETGHWEVRVQTRGFLSLFQVYEWPNLSPDRKLAISQTQPIWERFHRWVAVKKVMSSNREAVSWRHMAHWRYNDIKGGEWKRPAAGLHLVHRSASVRSSGRNSGWHNLTSGDAPLRRTFCFLVLSRELHLILSLQIL